MDGEGILPMPAEGSQFVESCHVIQMRVGIKDSINSVEFLTKGLLAEVGPAVDEHGGAGCLQMKGRSRAPVGRMV